MMYCHKCGAQIKEGAQFCHKCGVKAVYADTQSHVAGTPQTAIGSENINSVETMQQAAVETVQLTAPTKDRIDETNGFKTFVDNHVRETTEFQSAEELLNSTPPLNFVKLCLGIPVLLALVVFVASGKLMGALAFFVMAIAFGYLAALFMAAIKKGKCAFRYKGKIEGEIDIDDLIQFLNTYMDCLQPYFHEWGYIQRTALSVRGAVQKALADAARESTQEVGICTNFGKDQRRLSVIIIHADPLDRDSGKREYVVDAENRIEGASFLSHDNGFQKYKCVVRTAPVLQAAMEYYLNHYMKNHVN